MSDQVGISDKIITALKMLLSQNEHRFEQAMFSSACLGFYTQLVSSSSHSSHVVRDHCEIECYRQVYLEEP